MLDRNYIGIAGIAACYEYLVRETCRDNGAHEENVCLFYCIESFSFFDSCVRQGKGGIMQKERKIREAE